MSFKVLTPDEIEQFVELGYVRMPQVFARETAAAARDFLWKQIELAPDEPAGWTKPVVHLQKSFEGSPFDEALTPRFWDICDDVMGAGRWKPIRWLGWWPVNFPGFAVGPWQVPQTGWHVDGQQFHHHINSPDQGLLPIFLFSDIEPGDGGTAISVGSHKVTARILAEAEPDGLDVHALARAVAAQPRDEVIEATGQAGDVFVMHPFILHTRSMNTGSRVRFICNPCMCLHEPMNLNRDDTMEYSPVERAIVQALDAVVVSG
ncbi:MAG TPA: phytanoyl-CoA dioxygenase family protein [Abditibacteriaceae bacterium]|nr:phytanoyl-CoA dioxygenase family protein [Abditibacteriaceae bacterium]